MPIPALAAHLPAHQAARDGDVSGLERLLANDNGSDIIQATDDTTGETALHTAAEEGQLDCVNWLITHGDVYHRSKNNSGETPAHKAAIGGHLECLEVLIEHDAEKKASTANDADNQGLTCLHVATVNNKVATIKWLLDNYHSAAFSVNEFGASAVHFAAASGNIDILKLLIKHLGAAAVNSRDFNGATPIYFAAQEGRLVALQYLVSECGGDPMIRANDGMTAMHAATQLGHLETVRWLVGEIGTHVIADRTKDGASPVHYAAAKGYTHLLRWFIDTHPEPGVLARLTDSVDATPAHDAAEFGQVEALKLLLRHGADLFATDKDETSPYSLATAQAGEEIYDFVTEYVSSGTMAAQYRRKNAPVTAKPALEVLRPDNNKKISTTSLANYYKSVTPAQAIVPQPTEDILSDDIGKRHKKGSAVRTRNDEALEILEAQKTVALLLGDGIQFSDVEEEIEIRRKKKKGDGAKAALHPSHLLKALGPNEPSKLAGPENGDMNATPSANIGAERAAVPDGYDFTDGTDDVRAARSKPGGGHASQGHLEQWYTTSKGKQVAEDVKRAGGDESPLSSRRNSGSSGSWWGQDSGGNDVPKPIAEAIPKHVTSDHFVASDTNDDSEASPGPFLKRTGRQHSYIQKSFRPLKPGFKPNAVADQEDDASDSGVQKTAQKPRHPGRQARKHNRFAGKPLGQPNYMGFGPPGIFPPPGVRLPPHLLPPGMQPYGPHMFPPPGMMPPRMMRPGMMPPPHMMPPPGMMRPGMVPPPGFHRPMHFRPQMMPPGQMRKHSKGSVDSKLDETTGQANERRSRSQSTPAVLDGGGKANRRRMTQLRPTNQFMGPIPPPGMFPLGMPPPPPHMMPPRPGMPFLPPPLPGMMPTPVTDPPSAAVQKRIKHYIAKQNQRRASAPDLRQTDDDNVSISSMLLEDYEVGSTIAALALTAAVVGIGTVAPIKKKRLAKKLLALQLAALAGPATAATQEWELGEQARTLRAQHVGEQAEVEYRKAPHHVMTPAIGVSAAEPMQASASASHLKASKSVKRTGSFLDKFRGGKPKPSPLVPRDPFKYSQDMESKSENWTHADPVSMDELRRLNQQGKPMSAEDQLRGSNMVGNIKQGLALRNSSIMSTAAAALPKPSTNPYLMAEKASQGTPEFLRHANEKTNSLTLSDILWGGTTVGDDTSTSSDDGMSGDFDAWLKKQRMTSVYKAEAVQETLPRLVATENQPATTVDTADVKVVSKEAVVVVPPRQKAEPAQVTSAVVRVQGAQMNPVLVQLEAADDGSGVNQSLSLQANLGDDQVGATVSTSGAAIPPPPAPALPSAQVSGDIPEAPRMPPSMIPVSAKSGLAPSPRPTGPRPKVELSKVLDRTKQAHQAQSSRATGTDEEEEAGKRRQTLIRRHSQLGMSRGMTRKVSALEMRLGDSQLARELVMASEAKLAKEGGKDYSDVETARPVHRQLLSTAAVEASAAAAVVTDDEG